MDFFILDVCIELCISRCCEERNWYVIQDNVGIGVLKRQEQGKKKGEKGYNSFI